MIMTFGDIMAIMMRVLLVNLLMLRALGKTAVFSIVLMGNMEMVLKSLVNFASNSQLMPVRCWASVP